MQKTKLIILFCFIALVCQSNTNIWLATNSKVRFFSVTPIEDIEAENNTAVGALNAKTGRIFFKAMMRSFKFEKALMQEHFNENYVESDKFPSAEFDGIIENMPNLNVDGTYEVIIKGNLLIHGTNVQRELKASLKVIKSKIEAKAKFLVPCHEHNIKIPIVKAKNISNNIEVTIFANFNPKI